MSSTTIDRIRGINSGVAIKAPVVTATTANITLSGEQTIDGVAVVADDRVLVKNQTSGVENGIYVASTSAWSRDLDFDGNNDIVDGTLVYVNGGTVNGDTLWRVDVSGVDITVDTTAIVFTQSPNLTNTAAFVESYPDRTTWALLPKWRAALGKVAAATANVKVMCIGDSTTLGFASNGAETGNFRPLSFPNQFANMLNSVGIPAHSNSWMGDGNPIFSSDYDDRLSIGNSWTRTFVHVGGASWTATTDTNALSFTPTEPVDTFVVYYLSASGAGTFAMDINGGAATTQSSNAANLIRSVTITGTLGTNTLNIKWDSGGAVYIVGTEAYDSSKKWVSVINAGWSSSTASTWSVALTTGSNVSNALSQTGADLVLIMLGINDWTSDTPIATFTAAMQVLIDKAVATGDVVIIAPPPSGTDYATAIEQQAYVDALEQLAEDNDLPFIDIYTRLAPQLTSFNNGMYYEGLHPNGAGYADIALHVFERIGAVGVDIDTATGADTDPTYTTLAVGTATPDASAVAEFASTTKGLLVPRMTTTQMNAIASPVEGLVIYNTTTDAFYGYQASAWTRLAPNITITQTASASANITQALDFTTNIAYEIYISNIAPASEPADFIMKLTDDGSTYDAVTTHRGSRANGGTDLEEIGSDTSSGMLFDNQDSDANPPAWAIITISQPLTTKSPIVEYRGFYKNNSGASCFVSAGMHFAYSAAVTGVRFTYDNSGAVNLTTGTFVFKPIPR